jgi:hypothetical protein
MSQAEQRLVFFSGSVVATNATPVDVSDCRIQATSFVMLGLPSIRAGANAGQATVAVSDGKITITGGAADTSTYPYWVLSSPIVGTTREQSQYIR